MEYEKLPVAKRTRSGDDEFVLQKLKKLKNSRDEQGGDVVPPFENVVLNGDGDQGLSGVERDKSKELEKDCDASSDSDDVILLKDSHVQKVPADSDVAVVSVVDKGEGREIERSVDDDVVKVVNLDSSSEDSWEDSDECYREDDIVGSDDDESSDDAKFEDEGNKYYDDDYDTECGIEEMNDDKWKGKEKMVEGSGNENDGEKKKEIVEQIELGSFSDDEHGKQICLSDDSDEEIGSLKPQTSVERKNGEPIVKTTTQNDSASENVSSRNDGLQNHSLAETDDENGGDYDRYGVKRPKNRMMTTGRKSDKKLNFEKIFRDSLADKEESIKEIQEEEIKYKFWFPEKKKPVEKSEFEKEVDQRFAELNAYLAYEDIGSTQEEVDNGDQSKMQSDCSRGKHDLLLDEQIGLVCQKCSHVSQEIRDILPTFSPPDPQRRRRSHFVRPEGPLSSDYFQDMGSEQHDYEDYNTTESVWDLVPGARRSMYEHQREGFEFIWKNLAGGIIIEKLERPLSSSGSGCIISHAPGTGKTRLTIVFLQSFMRLYPESRPVIIAPKSMLLTWEEEFKKWKINVPFHNMNNLEFSGQENPAALSLLRKGRHRKNDKTLTRLVKLFSWKKNKSILGITYTLFDKLVRAETRNADSNPSEKQMGNVLLKLPSIIVLDEGHTPRNDQTGIYNSLVDVETERRIILSGTPFQNNFDELYNTLRLVNPKFDKKSSKYDGTMKKNLRKMSKELKSKSSGNKLMELKHMISPFVHVHKGKILQQRCPGLKDALIRLQPTNLQEELIAALRSKDLKNSYLELLHDISLVSVHPSLLPERCFQEHQFSAYRDELQRIKGDPYSGAKTKFVIELCRLSVALKERVLIYSQFINPLIFIKEQLQSYFSWTEGREVLYMDGSLEAKQRQSSISAINDPRSKARVLLASIKACSEGINLVGASRVVLLDVVWNPSVERQAISRAYRIGQTKIVYTYHLIAEDMEVQKYKVQTAKDRLSEMVFSSKDMDSLQKNLPDIVCEDRILQEMYQRNDKLGGLFKQIIYQPKESNLIDTFDVVEEE